MPNLTGQLTTAGSTFDFPGGDGTGNVIGNPKGENPVKHAKGGTADPTTFTPTTDPPITCTDFRLETGNWIPNYHPAEGFTLIYNPAGTVTIANPGPMVSSTVRNVPTWVGMTPRFKIVPDSTGYIQYVGTFTNISWGAIPGLVVNDTWNLGLSMFPCFVNNADARNYGMIGYGLAGGVHVSDCRLMMNQWGGGIAGNNGYMEMVYNQATPLAGQRTSPQAEIRVRCVHRFFSVPAHVGGIPLWRVDYQNCEISWDSGASYTKFADAANYMIHGPSIRFGITPSIGFMCRFGSPVVQFTISSFVVEKGIVFGGSAF